MFGLGTDAGDYGPASISAGSEAQRDDLMSRKPRPPHLRHQWILLFSHNERIEPTIEHGGPRSRPGGAAGVFVAARRRRDHLDRYAPGGFVTETPLTSAPSGASRLDIAIVIAPPQFPGDVLDKVFRRYHGP
jgi:hypothetical protein